MTTGNDTDPRDDALAKAWRARSQDLPPPALDATILAAAHRAVGSGPRNAGKQAREATRPQRWWMPLAAAATIGVVAIGILQIAPQAPVDIVVGERAEVASRVVPVVPAAPAKDAAPGNVAAKLKETAPATSIAPARSAEPATAAPSIAERAPVAQANQAAAVAPAPAPPAAAALADARRQNAAALSMPAPEPFPADPLPRKADAPTTARQNARKDAEEAKRAPAPSEDTATRSDDRAPSAPASTQSAVPASTPTVPHVAAAPPAPLAAPAPAPMVAQVPAPPAARPPAPSMLAPAPMKKESMAEASGSLATAPGAAGAAKPATTTREREAARDETNARNAPAASPELARSNLSPAEWQTLARDPDAWIARLRKLRAEGRVAEAVAELREFRRYVPDAETRLPADLRQWVPNP